MTVLNEIHEVNSGDQTEYQRVIAFSYTADTQIKRVTLIVDYAELSKGAAGKIAESSSIVNTDKVISGEFTLKNPSKTVAVLGNSFVGSSRIGEFLNQMFAASQSGYNAFPVARGYANVGTYSNDEYFLSLIENGEFCAVFQCGFYSAGEVDNLRAIKKACEKSDTLLVIFPAHNEVDSVLSSARSQFPELPYVDWKGEINALIQNGVYYGQMCIDDSHQHTTPLGGYVGAHMIYRSLFGSVPPVISGISDCDYSYITLALGDYVYSLEGAKTTPTFIENLYFK